MFWSSSESPFSGEPPLKRRKKNVVKFSSSSSSSSSSITLTDKPPLETRNYHVTIADSPARSHSRSKSSSHRRHKTYAESLFADGYVVIPAYSDQAITDALRAEIEQTALSFPEYKSHYRFDQLDYDKLQSYVLGGFSALGNPSSFHNPVVRQLREWCMAVLIRKLFRQFVQLPALKATKYNLEQIVDRLMIRPPHASVSAETWHRDEAVTATEKDMTFGGWINLDKTDQHFSCIPKSHKTGPDGKGFARIKATGVGRLPAKATAEQKAAHAAAKEKADKEHKQLLTHYDDSRVLVKIPPGHIIVFYEHIVHEIVKKTTPVGVVNVRLFLGWCLSPKPQPGHHPTALVERWSPGQKHQKFSIDAAVDKQAIFPLKSFQIPPMYPQLNWVNGPDRLEKWSKKNIVDECRYMRAVQAKGSKRQGESFDIVHREFPSLADSHLRKYPAYNAAEIALLKPHDSFMLLEAPFVLNAPKKRKNFHLYK